MSHSSSVVRVALLMLATSLLLSAARPARAQAEFLFSIGGPGVFDGASGVATECCGDRIFVTDRNLYRIQVFDREGAFLDEWGAFGAAPGELNDPDGISLDCLGSVHVADEDNDRIQVFDTGGVLERTISVPGTTPRGVAVTPDGESIWVADEGGNQLFRFDAAGTLSWTIGGLGRPFDVAAGCERLAFVAELTANRISAWDEDGNLVAEWPVPSPVAVATDCGCHVFVATQNSVRQFDRWGGLVAAWGGPGGGPGEFSGLAGLATDGRGRLYTAETVNQRVQVFDVSATTGGTSMPELTLAADVALWPPSHDYVVLRTGELATARGACTAAATVAIVGCSSSQPEDVHGGPTDDGGNGDGHTTEDCVIAEDGSAVAMRAERVGSCGPGVPRLYSIVVQATDACGRATTGLVQARVDHDRRGGGGPRGLVVPDGSPLPFAAVHATTYGEGCR